MYAACLIHTGLSSKIRREHMNLSQNNNGVEKLYMDLLKAYYPLTEQRLKHISPNNVMDRTL